VNSQVFVIRQSKMSPVSSKGKRLGTTRKERWRGVCRAISCQTEEEGHNSIPAITSGPWKCSSGCM